MSFNEGANVSSFNAIVGQGTRPASEFKPHPRNAREHPAEQYEALKASITADGFRSPIIVNRRTGYMIDFLCVTAEGVWHVEVESEEEGVRIAN